MVISTVNQVVYNGDGITTAWPYTFRIIDWTDIKLTIIDADGTETDVTADYFVDTVNNTVYYPGYAPGAEPPQEDQPPKLQEGQRLVVYRELPITQEKDLGEKWPFYVIELALDKLTMILQQIFDWWGRTLKVSQGATVDGFDTNVYPEAGKVITVNSDADGFECREALMEVNGVWDGEGRQIKTVQNPTDQQDVSTKNYVDSLVAGIVAQGSNITFCDNVAGLRAADLKQGVYAATGGYHEINDGGNAVYNIRVAQLSDVDDGGSIIILDNGNVAELINNGTVTLKQFGAKGDGVADDTTAFNNALSFASCLVVTKGTYLISFSAISLRYKKIIGENANDCIIKQLNKNVAFVRVGEKAEIGNITFVTSENDAMTPVLHHGRLDTFLKFQGHYIHHVNFEGNEYTVPLYYNFLNGGSSGGTVRDVNIKGCYKGIWFHFHTSDVATGTPWLTSHIMQDVSIVGPTDIGFEWDDLPSNPTALKNNISYNNYFGNISVELLKSGSTGFKIGNHMGVLENPVCYNDIVPTDDDPDPYGYSIEICPVGTPTNYKHYTKIIGGSLEGLIKNVPYMYLVNCQKLATSRRRHYGSEQYHEVYNSLNELNYGYLNIFDPLYMSVNCTLTNCTYRYREDHQGLYIEFLADSSIPGSTSWGWTIKIPKADIINNPDKYDQVTFISLASYTGNHRIAASGLSADEDTDPYYSYIRGPYNGSEIDLVHFNCSTDTDTGNVEIGFSSPKSDGTVCRVYGLYLLRGAVGAYWIVDKVNNNRLNVETALNEYFAKRFKPDGTNNFTVLYRNVFTAISNGLPVGLKAFGALPACTAGSSITIGTLDRYSSSSVSFKIVNNADCSVVGNLRVAYNGEVTYTAETTHGALSSVSGSY